MNLKKQLSMMYLNQGSKIFGIRLEDTLLSMELREAPSIRLINQSDFILSSANSLELMKSFLT